MQIRRVISAWIVVAALGSVPVLPAFQAEDTTKTVTKKAKKAKKATKEAAEPGSQGEPPSVGAAKRTAPPPERIVPESDIAAAKASGKVWVNTDSGVYHKGGQWYGATKQGKFMTEQEAIKAGYRAAKTK